MSNSGYRIASGTTVLPQFSMVHADPNEFERPDYFCPDRHIDSAGAFVKVYLFKRVNDENNLNIFRTLASLPSP